MGAHLSEPVRDKEIEDVTEGNISVGVASMQGWRNSMEDAHVFDLKVLFFQMFINFSAKFHSIFIFSIGFRPSI